MPLHVLKIHYRLENQTVSWNHHRILVLRIHFRTNFDHEESHMKKVWTILQDMWNLLSLKQTKFGLYLVLKVCHCQNFYILWKMHMVLLSKKDLSKLNMFRYYVHQSGGIGWKQHKKGKQKCATLSGSWYVLNVVSGTYYPDSLSGSLVFKLLWNLCRY